MKRVWRKSPHSIEVETFGLHTNLALNKTVLRAALATLNTLPSSARKQLESKRTYFLAISFISNLEMKKINKKYRNKNKSTDVLSFSRLEGMTYPTQFPEVGDILICTPVAKIQAKEYQTTLKREFERLTIHGVLHLFGYDHEKNKKEEKRMFRLQDKILESL